MRFSLRNAKLALQMDGEFQRGQRVALLGKSGAGKTSLLRALAGFDSPAQGAVLFTDKPAQEAWKRPVTLVHQQPVMYAHQTVAQTLAMATQTSSQRVPLPEQDWLRRLEIDELLDQRSTELSGGQQQRVALMRAILNQKSWLLLDESFSALDPKRLIRACDVLAEYCSITGAGLVLASHNDTPQRYLCDSAYRVDRLVGQTEPNLFSALKNDSGSPLISTLMVEVIDIEHGFLRTRVAGQDLYCPIPELWHTGEARVSLHASQIVIGIHTSEQSSMVNRLTATIERIDDINAERVLLTLCLQQQKLEVLVTHWSLQRLNLTVGQAVYADFKLSAVQWAGQPVNR